MGSINKNKEQWKKTQQINRYVCEECDLFVTSIDEKIFGKKKKKNCTTFIWKPGSCVSYRHSLLDLTPIVFLLGFHSLSFLFFSLSFVPIQSHIMSNPLLMF